MDQQIPVYIAFDRSYIPISGITIENISGVRSLVIRSSEIGYTNINENTMFKTHDNDGDIIMH